MDTILSFGNFIHQYGGPLAIPVLLLVLYIIALMLLPATTERPTKRGFNLEKSDSVSKGLEDHPSDQFADPKKRNQKSKKTNTDSINVETESKSSIERTIEGINAIISRRNIYFRWSVVILIALLLFGNIAITILRALNNEVVKVNTPSVSLLSISYSYDGWDPRIVDLRTAAVLGIAGGEKTSLHLFDVWVSSDTQLEDLGFQVKVEIYAGDELIGETDPVVIQPGAVRLGDIKIVKYANGNHPESLVIQKNWDALSVKVVCFSKTGKISETFSKIRLTDSNLSFLVSPPYAHFVSIDFSVNDEAPRLLDLSEALTKGIGVYGGSTLEIHSMKVRSSMVAADERMRAEAYIYENGWEEEIISRSFAFSDSVISLPFDQPMRWDITDKDKALVITLYRTDGTVLDSYWIPLQSTVEASLIDYRSAVVWPFEKITYLDFEKFSEIEEWQPDNPDLITLDSTTTQAFSGHRSLAVYLKAIEAGASSSHYILYRKMPIQSNLLIGQVYWPSREGIKIPYAALCIGGIGQCFDLPETALKADQWNTIYIDLAGTVDENNQPLSSQEFSSFYLQADVRGINAASPYLFFLDGFQIYPATTKE